MSRYRVPDHLICLGNGGNQVGETFMSQDWILSEVIRDDPRSNVDAPDKNQTPLHSYFIDTDDSTLPSDIESHVDNAVNRLEGDATGDHPNVNATVINVAKGSHERYLTPASIVADTRIRNLGNSLGLKAWWLGDEDSDILGPLNGLTKGGVSRKRGLTKAISRISEWKNDSLDQIVQNIQRDNDPHVAMIVGISGGTGSGLFIDLARRIKEAGAKVTLFAILPTPSGRDQENELANAYAALSELEYLALSKENYFRNIVLLPYDPAIDDDVFDKAATYTITSFYNLSGSQTNTYNNFDESEDMNGPPQYAPFTMASTRYLHYLKEDIEETRDAFQDYITTKEHALDVEESLYDELNSYISEHYPEAARQLYTTSDEASVRLPSDAAVPMHERLERIKRLLKKSFIQEIEFWSVGNLAEAYREVEQTSEEHAHWEDESDKQAAIARDFISRLAENINDVEAFEPTEGEWSAKEQEFIEQVVQEFELVARRAGIVRAVNAILEGEESQNVDDIAVDIRNAIDADHGGYGTQVESRIDSLIDEIDSLDAEIQRLETLCERAEVEASDIVSEWANDAKQTAENYYLLHEKKSEIDSLLEQLQEEIAKSVSGLANKRESSNLEITGTGFDQYDRLNSLLREVGASDLDEDLIEDSVEKARQARKKQLMAQERSGTPKETVRGLIGRGTIDGLRTDYQQLRDENIDNRLISISEWSKEFEVKTKDGYIHNRLSSLDSRENQLLNELVDKTRNAVEKAEQLRDSPSTWISDDANVTYIEDFEFDEDVDATVVTDKISATANKSSTPEQFCKKIANGPVDSIISDVLINPLKQKHEEIKINKDKKQKDADSYSSLVEIVQSYGGKYQTATEKIPNTKSIAAYEEAGEQDPFKVDMKPVSRGRVGNSSDLRDTKLWEKGEERNQIQATLADVVPYPGDEFLPIKETQIEDGNTQRVDYDGHRVASSVMSPLFEEFMDDNAAEIEAVTNALVDNAQVTENDYKASRGAFADKYDIALTTFLGGVFLDNIRVFTEECRRAYLDNTDVKQIVGRHNECNSVPQIVKSHTYGLDGVQYHDEDDFLPDESDGGFCYRSDILNFDTDGTNVLLDNAENEKQNNKEVVQTLLEEYYEIVGYPSTVDMK